MHESAQKQTKKTEVQEKNEISKLLFSPLEGEEVRPLTALTAKERADFDHVTAEVEIFFGKTRLTLKELAALEKGSLLPLDDLCDDLVDIYVNGDKIGRGEILTVDGHFGVKIISLT